MEVKDLEEGVPFSKDGLDQVGPSQPCTLTCEQVNQLPTECRFLGATDGNRALAEAAPGLSQPRLPLGANTLSTGTLCLQGTSTECMIGSYYLLPLRQMSLLIATLFPL